MTLRYFQMPGFESVYLEDSFVLGVTATPGLLIVDLDVVLTEDHPSYKPPPPNEHHCYRRGQIRFHGVRRLHWIAGGTRPAIDASGVADYGGVHELSADGSSFVLTGDFGNIDVEALECVLVLDPRD